MSEWIKWRIADFLNWYHGDQVCWARLVMWVVYDGDIDGLWYSFSSVDECQNEKAKFGRSCYCGKIQYFPFLSPRFILLGRIA